MVEYHRLDGVYGALSNAVRRELIERLAVSPSRVSDLAQAFDISFAGVSKHVRVLEEAGLVRREILGREHRITLDAAPLADASGWLAHYRHFWEERLDLLNRRLTESHRR